VAIHPGRVWVKSDSDTYESLTLPDLKPEAQLTDILNAQPDPTLRVVEDVYFPAEVDAVRVLVKSGFLWDVHPDLKTVTKLHHDTPVPQTPSLTTMSTPGSNGEIELPSGRVAILGGGSKRPALRVADQRGALETTEVRTPHDGFLDGVLLLRGWNEPVLRDDDVFIRHTDEATGGFVLSRVSTRDGLRWSRGEAEWVPGGAVTGAKRELVALEDRGDRIVLWLDRMDEDIWSGGDHFLVGVDPATGDALYVTPF